MDPLTFELVFLLYCSMLASVHGTQDFGILFSAAFVDQDTMCYSRAKTNKKHKEGSNEGE